MCCGPQVPPEALLDVDVEEEGGTSGAEDHHHQQVQQQTVQGEIAFLSHEPVVATSKLKGRPRAGEVAVTVPASSAWLQVRGIGSLTTVGHINSMDVHLYG